jgi:hypothetical protein
MDDAAGLNINPDLLKEIVGEKARSRKAVTDEDLSRFIGCPVWWLCRVLPAVKSKHQLVVALYLWRRRVVRGNRNTFDVPNNELRSWGISRKVKYQTLDWLAAAGVIKINCKGKKALTVTILFNKPRKKKS